MARSSALLVGSSIILVAIGTGVGCGSSGDIGSTSGFGGTGGATSSGSKPASSATNSASGGGDSTGAFTTGTGATCSPACATGKFCSAIGTCIDDGSCTGNADCKTAGTVCDPMTLKCVPGGCNAVKVPASYVPPNLFITLDRSCSMTETVTGSMTKWDIAVASLNKLTTDFASKIRFGLTLFPDLDSDKCAQGTIPIPLGPGNETMIQTLLTNSLMSSDQYFPDGPCVTNIDTGIEQAATDPGLMDTTRGDYVMLVTDGSQSGCSDGGGNMGTLMAIQQLATAGIHTFVIGFGGEVNTTQLNSFATAGLEPSTGTNQYYDASDQASLDATFQAIASKTVGCVFQLATPPQDPSQLYAFFDDVSVPRDPTHMNGWDYDATKDQVTFYGMDCDELKMGSVMSVDIVYGCDQPPQ